MAARQETDLRATTRHVLEASKEIVIDHLFLTKTLMHAIRNNLPVELSSAQIDPIIEAEAVDDVEAAIAHDRPTTRRSYPAILVLVGFSTLVVGAMVAWTLQARAERAEANFAASHGIHAAVAVDLERPEVVLEVAEQRWNRGDAQGTVALLEPLWERRVRSSVTAPLLAQAHLKAGEYEKSRDVARQVLADDPANLEMKRLFNASLASDPAFEERWVDLSLDSFDEIERVGDGILVLRKGEKEFELVLATEDRPDDWEDPIAAYRLCLAMKCAFEMPRAIGARLDLQSLAVFAALEGYDTTFASSDGAVVRGALVDAAARDYPRLPIERTRTWRAMLDAKTQLDDRPATEVLAKWKKREKKLWPEFEPEIRNLGSVSLSRQLASMLVFDYMANNWNRFHWRDHGKAMRVKDGKLWALGHAGAFKTRRSKRVSGRFRWTDRLGSTDVAAAVALDLDTLGKSIFVSGSKESLEKIETMKRQQRSLTKRVEKLEERWGSETVFAFRR